MLNAEERKTLSEIKEKYYMPPVVSRLETAIEHYGHKEAFKYLHTIIRDAQSDVMEKIQERKRLGLITDVSQASKSVVGAIFSYCIEYLFLRAKENGCARQDVFVTSKVAKYKELISITVGDETQKPDMDLVFYTLDEAQKLKNIMIVSLKTSLRERASQTYKWKLLLEIATTENAIKDKYNITYPLNKTPLVCFATVNFYNEINNPQHRGMFKFFDKSFIGKPIESGFIDNLSTLVDYVNSNL